MPSLLKYPTTTSTPNLAGTEGNWANPANIYADDGSNATDAYWSTAKGGTDLLTGYTLGYGLPSTAIIDGIKLEMNVVSSNRWSEGGSTIKLHKANSPVGNNKAGTGSVTSSVWTYGGETDLWGTTWTPAEINAAGFGFGFSGALTSSPADFAIAINYIRVTVYYHLAGTTSPADVPTREIFKVRNQKGVYIGLMPKPVEALKIAQDMNTLGSQITLKVPVSIDTAGSDAVPYTTEDGSANYTDESGSGNYVTEGDLPIVSAAFQGIDTLIKNGNTVECWLYNYFYPNGKCMFIGKIRRWEADGGGGGDCVDVVLYSTSYDLANYYTRGAPFTYTNDQSQTSQNASVTVSAFGGGWNKYGQTFVPTAANHGAVTLKLNGTARVTVNMYTSLNGTLMGTTSQNVAVGAPTDIQFGFPNLITDTPGNTYFFEVLVDSGQSITLYYQNTDVYASGSAYNSNYGGGSGGGSWGAITGDLYFITASGTASTTAIFTAKDPTTEMFKPIITDYNLRGGTQQWTVSSVDATGLSLNYTFKVQTVFQAMQAILEMCPAGFYYYVDIGAQIIYFKNASTTADFLLQKGVHLTNVKIAATTEESVNTLPFTGGEVTPGVNLYKLYTNAQSIAAFGPLLQPKTDNRVVASATADAIGNSTLAEFAGEKYGTVVTLAHTTKLDLTLLTPGKTVGFRGFGSFIDQIITQIVRREWSAGEATLTLGVLPMRLSTEVAELMRQLQQEQTEYNPSTPS